MNHRSRLARMLFTALFFAIYVVGAGFFAFLFGTSLQTMNGERLGPVVFPVLAVFYGFSSLLYNRSRALSSGPEQRRSLYAAERSLQATVLLLCGVALAAGVHVFFLLIGRTSIALSSAAPNDQFYAALLPVLLVGFAWLSFFFALLAMAHRFFRWQRPKAVLRRLK